jgi:MOSC domain-containing protein YiiM
MTMKLVSFQVGLPREVFWQGRSVTTRIFKEPVTGSDFVRMLDLDGDAQADLSLHGGPDKAVYAYPIERYAYWRQELPGMTLPNGMFGKNLTTEGLLEIEVNIGDRLRIGGPEFVVTQPRAPCYKLAIKFGRADILKRFLASRRSGSILRSRGKVRYKPETGSKRSVGMAMASVLKILFGCLPLNETIWKHCGAPCRTKRCPKAGVATPTSVRKTGKRTDRPLSNRR